MPARPGSQVFTDLLATTGQVQLGGADLEGEGYIVGIFGAGTINQRLQLLDADSGGDVIFDSNEPFIGAPSEGCWVPRDQWLPYTDGVWASINGLATGFTLAVQPGRVTAGP